MYAAKISAASQIVILKSGQTVFKDLMPVSIALMSEEILGIQLLEPLLTHSRVLGPYPLPRALWQLNLLRLDQRRLNPQRLQLPQRHLRKRNQTVARRAALNRAGLTLIVQARGETRRIDAITGEVKREAIRLDHGPIG